MNLERVAPSVAELTTLESVVEAVMDAFRPLEKDDDGWQFSNTQQEVAGSLYWGCLVLKRFSVERAQKLDAVGRLQPGAFAAPSTLQRYLLQDEKYRTFAMLSEWRPVAPPVVRGRAASQSLLVRREFSHAGAVLAPANWEELQLGLELRQTPDGERWAVASLYKDYHGPTAGVPSAEERAEAEGLQPEEERNC